jgi:hypothetical protein
VWPTTLKPGTLASRSSTSSAIPLAKYSWSFFSLRSRNGRTAMDLSLTTLVPAVFVCSDGACFDSHSLFART